VNRNLSLLFSLLFALGFCLSPSAEAFQEESKPAQDEKTTEEEQTAETVNKASTRAQARHTIEMTAPADTQRQRVSDLKHYLSDENVQSLLVGPNEHTVLIETHATVNNKGVMILLPDWQQGATSPKATNYLRTVLPDHGWSTITIQPPNKPLAYPSTAEQEAQRQQENNETLASYQQELAALLTVVNDKAKSYPGIIIMISEGNHAALLYSMYQQNLIEQPMAYISLSGFLPDDVSALNSASSLAQIDLPVLDLSLKTDNRLIQQNVALRQKRVNQEHKAHFRQKQLFNIQTGYYPEAILIKEINGWLRSIGW